jgi:hypothetical protein
MARKTRKRMITGKLYDPETQEYWNRLLAQEGLSLDQGINPRLSYVGDSVHVEVILGMRDVRDMLGGVRKSPKPSLE